MDHDFHVGTKSGPIQSPSRWLRSIGLALILVGAVSLSCPRYANLARAIGKAGGPERMREEVGVFIDLYKKSNGGEFLWRPERTQFPAAIAAMRPQSVHISRQGESVLFVDVRVTSGFMHHGLLVAPSDLNVTGLPRISNWQVTKLAPGIFEYRE
jgi:hypothetical protein